jgi:hypothetical protein
MAIVALDQKKRRTYRGEEKWFPLLEELGFRRLRHAFIVAGLSPQVAGGIVWFLDDQRHLDRHQTDQSRVRYREALARLDPADVRVLANRSIPG